MSAPNECPLCGKPRDERYKPFCSRRCADLDLGQWLKGGYAIPGVVEEEQDLPPQPPSNDDDPI